ncbi:MAG TPA: hypothetical protein PKB02_02440 [Anaerohalosphaeraceae bacterium]|nr:hypothetical protein [Anaerohalosphaeraceae bacterium]
MENATERMDYIAKLRSIGAFTTFMEIQNQHKKNMDADKAFDAARADVDVMIAIRGQSSPDRTENPRTQAAHDIHCVPGIG